MRGTVSIKPKRIGADSDSPDLNKYDVKGEDSSAFAQFDIVAVTSLAGNGSYKQVKRAQAGGAGLIGSGRFFVALHAFGATEQGRVAEWAIETGVNTSGKAVGDPVFLSASTPGARTLTNPGNGIQVGYVARVDATNGAYYLCPQAFGGAAAASAASTEIADPGDAGAIAVADGGHVHLTTAGAETRTLAAPTFLGQELTMSLDVDGGDCVVTVATGVDAYGSTAITLNDAGDWCALRAIQVGGALRWRVVRSEGVLLNLDGIIADPGDAGAIPVNLSGSVSLVSAGAETRTLADPTFRGQKLTLYCDTYVGDIGVTAASPINVANNTVMTFGAASEHITLEAVTVGGALVWQVGSNDGVGLT